MRRFIAIIAHLKKLETKIIIIYHMFKFSFFEIYQSYSLGKGEVGSSILLSSTIYHNKERYITIFYINLV